MQPTRLCHRLQVNLYSLLTAGVPDWKCFRFKDELKVKFFSSCTEVNNQGFHSLSCNVCVFFPRVQSHDLPYSACLWLAYACCLCWLRFSPDEWDWLGWRKEYQCKPVRGLGKIAPEWKLVSLAFRTGKSKSHPSALSLFSYGKNISANRVC